MKKLISDIRLHFHYAIQPLASATNYLNPEPEGRHTALVWNTDDKCMQTKPFGDQHSIIVMFDPLVCSLTVKSAEDMFQFDLKKKTLSYAYNWLKMVFNELGINPNQLVPLDYPTYDFPYHPLALGNSFETISEDAKKILIDLFDRSFLALKKITDNPIGLYPHHFDLATLIHHEDKSIGLGFSPGDQSYDCPYWYVYVYPYPSILPGLSIGHWHTQGWKGMVMTWEEGEDITIEKIKEFFIVSIKVANNLLGIEK